MAGHKFGAAGNARYHLGNERARPLYGGDTFAMRGPWCSHRLRLSLRRGPEAGAREEPAWAAAGDYARPASAGRGVRIGSLTHGTPGKFVRLEYAIDMRYGCCTTWRRRFLPPAVDVTMVHATSSAGYANEQALRLLAHCTAPASPLNRRPGVVSVRWLRTNRQAGSARSGGEVERAPTSWLVARGRPKSLLGVPRVPCAR